MEQEVEEQKLPIKWRAVFAESAFICASILLAFALQDWDEAKDIEERTQIALCNVKSELAFNRVLLHKDYMPRQKGLAATLKAAITISQQSDSQSPPIDSLQDMLIQESLRYSAWSLAGESGYLLHVDFELATEIGSIVDFQEDSYQPVVSRINAAIFENEQEFYENRLELYIKLNRLVNEWTSQTKYLEGKYNNLFSREDFTTLDCD